MSFELLCVVPYASCVASLCQAAGLKWTSFLYKDAGINKLATVCSDVTVERVKRGSE